VKSFVSGVVKLCVNGSWVISCFHDRGGVLLQINTGKEYRDWGKEYRDWGKEYRD
jgi:hypothetical protein